MMKMSFKETFRTARLSAPVLPARLQGLAAFEARLCELFASGIRVPLNAGPLILDFEQHGLRGEIILTLVAAEMRDFCLIDRLEEDDLTQLAISILTRMDEIGATRLKVGPLSEGTSAKLAHLLSHRASSFVFRDVALSVEPLIVKPPSNAHFGSKSLRRALRDAKRAGLRVSSRVHPAEDMAALHSARWGENRPSRFFYAMEKLAREAFCDSISITDGQGRMIGQQIDFFFGHERFYYFSTSASEEFPNIGTALLAESIRRFFADTVATIYSFGRGGETYKFRYANRVRLNHYIVGFRSGGMEFLTS